MQPDHFFIAGAQRSSTTYLYHLCAEHPQIEMAQPVKPEPKFFITDALYQQGIEYYERQYFQRKDGIILRGEKSTSYIEVEKAAQRISTHFPNARIIFILRDPIERAISNYWFSVKNGLEKLPIEQAFMMEESRREQFDPSVVSVSPFAYLRRGRYIDYLEMYTKYFSRDQIFIAIQEKITHSKELLRELYTFLGVESGYVPDSIYKIINANDEKPSQPISDELRQYLLSYFAEPTAALEHWLGFPLEQWK